MAGNIRTKPPMLNHRDVDRWGCQLKGRSSNNVQNKKFNGVTID